MTGFIVNNLYVCVFCIEMMPSFPSQTQHAASLRAPQKVRKIMRPGHASSSSSVIQLPPYSSTTTTSLSSTLSSSTHARKRKDYQ